MNSEVIIFVTFYICLSATLITFMYYHYRCKHSYKEIERIPVYNRGEIRSLIIIDRCEHCGKIRQVKIKD